MNKLKQVDVRNLLKEDITNLRTEHRNSICPTEVAEQGCQLNPYHIFVSMSIKCL